jgi:hypothetical protein
MAQVRRVLLFVRHWIAGVVAGLRQLLSVLLLRAAFEGLGFGCGAEQHGEGSRVALLGLGVLGDGGLWGLWGLGAVMEGTWIAVEVL